MFAWQPRSHTDDGLCQRKRKRPNWFLGHKLYENALEKTNTPRASDRATAPNRCDLWLIILRCPSGKANVGHAAAYWLRCAGLGGGGTFVHLAHAARRCALSAFAFA